MPDRLAEIRARWTAACQPPWERRGEPLPAQAIADAAFLHEVYGCTGALIDIAEAAQALLTEPVFEGAMQAAPVGLSRGFARALAELNDKIEALK